jgi:hypothetical protein
MRFLWVKGSLLIKDHLAPSELGGKFSWLMGRVPVAQL